MSEMVRIEPAAAAGRRVTEDRAARQTTLGGPAASGPARPDKDDVLKSLEGRWYEVYRRLGVIRQATASSNGWYSCCSPLRSESRPSFGFSNTHGGFIDHGTEESGDAIELVMQKLAIDFVEALQRLAEMSAELNGGRGATVKVYAQERKFDVDWLAAEFLLDDGTFGDRDAIVMPYLDAAGRELGRRYRIALDGADRFRWSRGTKASELVYGLDKMKDYTGELLYVTEGESNLHAARRHGLQCLTIPGKGSGHAQLAQAIASHSTIKTVVILLDPDADKLADSIGAELGRLGWTGELKAVTVQDVCGVKDLCDLHVTSSDAEFDAAVRKLLDAAEVVGGDVAPQRPSIATGDKSLHVLSNEVIEALTSANSPPAVLQQQGRLCRVRTLGDRRCAIEGYTEDSLRGRMSEVADYTSVQASGVEKKVFPPKDVVKDILSRPSWSFPSIDGIVSMPVVGVDGSLIVRPGYDAASRLWYEPNHGPLPEIPKEPTPDQVKAARELLLDDLFFDFPFDGPASKANAIAAALVPFVRPLIDGPTPLHAVDAPTAGTGKGLLVDAITIPVLGQPAQAMTEAKDDEEWRKRVMAALVTGSSVLFVDNVNRSMKSGALASALTATTFSDRELGSSRILSVPVRCLWLATGNNLSMSDEINRRVVLCRIDAKVDQPYLRNGFKHPELREWARQNREQLIAAYLTLIQAWIAAGRPAGKQTMGSYEQYARVVGGILEVAGIAGFLANLQESYQRGNEETNEWRAFVQAWWHKFEGYEVGVSDLYDRIIGDQNGDSLILGNALRGPVHPQGRKVKLGQLLKKKRDNVIGGYRITIKDQMSRNGSVIYRLLPMEPVQGTPHSLQASPAGPPQSPPQDKSSSNGPLGEMHTSAGDFSGSLTHEEGYLSIYKADAATPIHPPQKYAVEAKCLKEQALKPAGDCAYFPRGIPAPPASPPHEGDSSGIASPSPSVSSSSGGSPFDTPPQQANDDRRAELLRRLNECSRWHRSFERGGPTENN